jgi:hypothetical protein
MTLIFLILVAAVVAGVVRGGRPSKLADLRIRWLPAAIAGFAFQLAPWPSRTWAVVILWVSFALVGTFTAVNLTRFAGFRLVLVGLFLNVAVIGLNGGMPVTRDAIVRSGQVDTEAELGDAAKHRLAAPDDRLVFLADAIPIPPIHDVVSVGDLLVYAGVAWVVVSGMGGRGGRPRRFEEEAVVA